MKNNSMEKHEQFILDELLPTVINHARRISCSSDEAALASFMALGTILLKNGIEADSLFAAVKASAFSTHDAQGGLQ